MHWAITGHTASELIKKRVDASKPHVGLQTWKYAPTGKILKSDVSIAKNFLTETELRKLNRVVTMYLDYAEAEFEKFRVDQDREFVSDFDRAIRKKHDLEASTA